jgi:hypothetical protein
MKKFKALSRVATIPALLLGTAFAPFLSMGAAHALTGTTYKWTGECTTLPLPANCTSSALTWSQPGNWALSSDGGVTYGASVATVTAPQSTDNAGLGDNIVFDNSLLTADVATTNDISGLTVNTISTITAPSGFFQYTVSTQGLTVKGGIPAAAGQAVNFSAGLTFAGDQDFGTAGNYSAAVRPTGAVTVASGTLTAYAGMNPTTLTIAGGATYKAVGGGGINALAGSGSLVLVTPTGTNSNYPNQFSLYDSGAANTFTGTIDAQKGTILGISGNAPANALGSAASVTIEDGAQLNIYVSPTVAAETATVNLPNTFVIAGNGAGVSQMNQGAVMAGMYDQAKNQTDGALAVNFTGSVSLSGDTKLASVYATVTTYNFSGTFNKNGHAITALASAQPTYGQTIVQVGGVTVANGNAAPAAPGAPDTGFAPVSAKVLPVLATTIAAAGGLLYTARRVKPVRR